MVQTAIIITALKGLNHILQESTFHSLRFRTPGDIEFVDNLTFVVIYSSLSGLMFCVVYLTWTSSTVIEILPLRGI
jgi:hypothetical protein